MATGGVERWLSEPTERSLPPIGLAGSLFETILSIFTVIVQRLARLESQSYRRTRSELERLLLWGTGFSATEGRLDELLEQSAELRQAVLSTLYELGKLIMDDLLPAVDELMWTQAGVAHTSLGALEAASMTKDLQSLLENAALLLEDTETPREFDQLSDNSSTRYGVEEILEDASIYIDCLMDLSLALESPMPDLESTGQLQQELETFSTSSALAMALCRRIRDRFPQLPKYLVERLGEANAERQSMLKNRRAKRAVDKLDEISTSTLDKSENLFSESQPKMTTASQTYMTGFSDSVFDKPLTPAALTQVRTVADDTFSNATFATFSEATRLSTVNSGRLRVPPLPEEAARGEPFTCIACHRSLSDITTRLEWKRHIFDDLLPYLCTHEKCSERFLYSSIQSWIVHEAKHRVKTRRCPFCSDASKSSLSARLYFKHVAEHLREVSLAVLPQNTDEDEDEEEDESVASFKPHLDGDVQSSFKKFRPSSEPEIQTALPLSESWYPEGLILAAESMAAHAAITEAQLKHLDAATLEGLRIQEEATYDNAQLQANALAGVLLKPSYDAAKGSHDQSAKERGYDAAEAPEKKLGENPHVWLADDDDGQMTIPTRRRKR